MAAPGIEIQAGRNRDSGFIQNSAAEAEAVIGQVRNVGIDVESTVDGGQTVESGLGQLIE